MFLFLPLGENIRKPETIEYLYLDFDGFFASVEQQARPALRGKPVGVVPFDNTLHTVVIACSIGFAANQLPICLDPVQPNAFLSKPRPNDMSPLVLELLSEPERIAMLRAA